ncbi:MAG: ABC transporter permease [Actinomycetota bacterium]|nr:ABC transporter permease [Actinomycetota bacterium]
MSTAATTRRATTSDVVADRDVPPLGGFNGTLLGIELKRMLRNRRTMIFTIVMPAAFFLIFGVGQDYGTQSAGRGNVIAYIMVSMALYGAMIATTGAGAMVATERAQGWSRQLRLTPLSPVAYIVVKVVVALLMGLIAIVVVYAVGLSTGAKVDDVDIVVTTALIAWGGSLVFAAFGLFMGYLLPSENVMQILGPGLAILAFGGGVFIPLTDGSGFEMFARFTPMYGVAKLARLPLTGGDVQWWWLLNTGVWLLVFAGGAAMLMSRDTDRV